MTIPFNRFVTFVKPWLNVIAGAVAAWFVAKANVLGIHGLDEANTATWVSGALAWALTTGAVQLGDLKWLQGHHITIENDGLVAAAAVSHDAPGATPSLEDAEASAVADDELPSDDEEFAAPPPDESNTPVQPSQGTTGEA
jgi:hypothetical protein